MDIIGKGYEHIKSLCFQCSIISFYWSCGYLVLVTRVLSLLMQIMCLKRLHILQTPTLFQHVGTKLQPCNKLLIKHWNCNKLLICLLKKKLWPLLISGVQLPQGYSHFEEAIYFLPLSSQKFLVLIFINLGRMKGWVNLGATQWPWMGPLDLESCALPLGYCSIMTCLANSYFCEHA